MRRTFYFTLAFILLQTGTRLAFSQSPLVKQWDKRFGGRQTDFLNDFSQTTDGGFILGGFSLSGLNGDKSQPSRGGNDYWVVKTDMNGIKQWDKRFGGSLSDYLTSVQQTRDGGYILGGNSLSGSNGDKSQPGRGLNDYWIVKLDSTGVKEWDKRFGGTDEEFFTRVIQTTDGGFLAAGVSRSDSSGDKSQPTNGNYDFWIVKTDSIGNKIWDVDLGGIDDDQLATIQLTKDGGYILGGSSNSGIGGDKTQPVRGNYDYWILKIDSMGVKQWDRDFGGIDMDKLESLQERSDYGYILGGFSLSGISGDKTTASWGSNDYWLIKIDSTGNMLWDKDFGSSGIDDEAGSMIETRDGGYLICGESQSPIGGDKSESNLGVSQAWIVKTDSSGTTEWEKTILTNPEHKLAPYIIQTRNGCFAIAHASWSGIAGYKTQEDWDTTHSSPDYWLILYCDTTAFPVALFSAGNSLCPGTCTSFENLALYATSYQWIFNGANPNTSIDENPQNICYATPGNYDVTLIASNLNGSDTLLLSNYITVFPFPPPQSITQNGDTLFALPGAQSYQWYFNGSVISGATDFFYVAGQSGNYNVVSTGVNGCEVEAAIFDVIANFAAVFSNEQVTGYPNPVIDYLTMPAPSGIEHLAISIYNSLGAKVYAALECPSGVFDCSLFPSGIYMIELSNQNKTTNFRFMKQ
ncbi:MAG: T9SS type A sorting domain-containing protein [Bacteroidota bacterium]